MRRLFYKGALADEIEITGTDAHHLLHVLRAKAGQQLTTRVENGEITSIIQTCKKN